MFLLSSAPATRAQLIHAEEQERVAELIQSVIGSYPAGLTWTNGAFSSSSSGAYTNIEAKLREASKLMPKRLDLRYGIASALIGQALQTNFSFEAKMNAALRTYREIQAIDPKGFQAAILFAAYSRALGQTNAADKSLRSLLKRHPAKTRAYLETFQRIDAAEQIAPSTNFTRIFPNGTNHAIVILGAGLETNGRAKPKLVERLKKGLLLAKEYPDSPILVTGGNQRAGITEAYVMGQWLLKEGISTNRVYLEDQARDTLGNAVRCCLILERLRAAHVTLVTNSSHVRRALADFEEAAARQGVSLTFSHLAAADAPDPDAKRVRISLYRDVLRASGIWTFPGIQR